MKLTVTDSDLRIELTPMENLLGLHRSFTVPRSHVVAAGVVPSSEAAAGRGLRAPGVNLPGSFSFGTWRSELGREFRAVRRPGKVLVLDLRDEPYHRIVLEVPDADRALADLASELHKLAGRS